MEDQKVMMKVMGEAVAELSEEFVHGAISKFLTAIDATLADTNMSDIEKFGSIKVIMDIGWKRMTAVVYSDPDITVGELAAKEVGPFLTGDKGMDDVILESLGLERKSE